MFKVGHLRKVIAKEIAHKSEMLGMLALLLANKLMKNLKIVNYKEVYG
jgi:hypothetical protein